MFLNRVIGVSAKDKVEPIHDPLCLSRDRQPPAHNAHVESRDVVDLAEAQNRP